MLISPFTDPYHLQHDLLKKNSQIGTPGPTNVFPILITSPFRATSVFGRLNRQSRRRSDCLQLASQKPSL